MRTPKLKPCPCGRVPNALFKLYNTDTSCWDACGSCCRMWSVSFLGTKANASDDGRAERDAVRAWNKAPRADSLEVSE